MVVRRLAKSVQFSATTASVRSLKTKATQTGREGLDVQAAVAQPAIDLLDGVFGREVAGDRERFADRVDGERRGVKDDDDAVGQREHTPCVQVLANQILDELVDGGRVEPVRTRRGWCDGGRVEGSGHTALARQVLRTVEGLSQERRAGALRRGSSQRGRGRTRGSATRTSHRRHAQPLGALGNGGGVAPGGGDGGSPVIRHEPTTKLPAARRTKRHPVRASMPFATMRRV